MVKAVPGRRRAIWKCNCKCLDAFYRWAQIGGLENKRVNVRNNFVTRLQVKRGSHGQGGTGPAPCYWEMKLQMVRRLVMVA